jgi:hypothetical protein
MKRQRNILRKEVAMSRKEKRKNKHKMPSNQYYNSQ